MGSRRCESAGGSYCRAEGLEVPTLSMRYFMAQDFAKAAASGMRLAVVTEPALIDAKKFGVTALANQGLRADVFLTEPEAVAWLLAK